MGELDGKPFMNVVKVKYGSADVEKAIELVSLWEDHLRDPSWHPYKVVMVGETHKVCFLPTIHHLFMLSLYCLIRSLMISCLRLRRQALHLASQISMN